MTNTMKLPVRNTILTALMMLIIVSSYAQFDRDRKDQVESQRVAFITSELELSTQESQSFWPIYNEYKKKEREITKRTVRLVRGESTEDATKRLDDYLRMEDERLELQKEYVGKLKSSISAEKILKLFKVEKDFVRTMLREYRRRGRQ